MHQHQHRALKRITRNWIFTFSIAFYYTFIITDAHFNLFQPVNIGLTFNSMLKHLLRGEFDVSPNAVRFEGFTRNGQVYAYWGIFCALIRIPLLFFPHGMQTDVTFLSCVIAACMGTFVKLRTLWIIQSNLPHSLIVLTALYIAFAGASLGFLKASVYQEVLYWAEALASAFVFLAIKGLVSGRFSVLLLTGMALLAGLGLLTRVTFGIGMYAAIGLLLLSLVKENGVRALFLPKIFVPTLFLTIFAILTGLVNYYRWGSPIVFMYNEGYALNPTYPDRLERHYTYGDFNLSRIPYSFDYYFGFLWAFRNTAGFLFQEAHSKIYDVFELPPSSFAVTELFPLVVCFAGVLGAWQTLSVSERYKIGAITVGLWIQAVLMLSAISTAYRYRLDFYPQFEFLLFVGLMLLGRLRNSYIPWLRVTLTAAVVVSIFSAHAELALYKLSPLGMYYLNARGSLTDYYGERLKR